MATAAQILAELLTQLGILPTRRGLRKHAAASEDPKRSR
jgi:hypothetical protein